MKRLSSLLFIVILFLLISCQQENSSGVTVGIIEPIEHEAINEVVANFSKTLRAAYHAPVTIKIENAQNDMNLQRAMIQKMRDANYALIVPFGMDATQMTLSMVHDKPILGLAADVTEADRKKPCQVTAVRDEIPAEIILKFIHAAYPTLTQLTLVHSASNKVFPEVKKAVAAGKSLGITVHPLMAASLVDLYNVAQAIPAQSQGIFILKDNMIASGIATLMTVADKRDLPLITSDEGSVRSGAGFALGVYERDIGIEGGKLAAQILTGKNACSLPIVTMKKFVVFINKSELAREGQSASAIIDTAKQFHYNVEMVTTKSGV